MSRPELPAFNPEAACPKCGHADVSVLYQDSGCPYPYTCGEMAPFGSEHLDRTCQRCHHRWAEAVIEQEPRAQSSGEGE